MAEATRLRHPVMCGGERVGWRSIAQEIGKPIRVRAGQLLFEEGKEATTLFYIISGRVHTFANGPNGKGFMIADLRSGEFLPVSALLANTLYGSDGVAQTDCELLAIASAELRRRLLNDASLASHFLELALQRLNHRTDQLRDVTFLSAAARIAKWILQSARDGKHEALCDGVIIRFELPERLVALAAGGMSREAASRQLAWLKKNGFVERIGKDLKILDLTRLQALSEGAEPLHSQQFSLKSKKTNKVVTKITDGPVC